MEYNLPSELVNNLDFGDEAKQRVIEQQEKLNKATKEYNEATAKTPSNLMKIALAKKELEGELDLLKNLI